MFNIPFLKNKKTQVLRVTFEADNQVSYRMVLFSQEDNQLIINEKMSFKSFQEVLEGLDKKVKLLIHFSGKGILNKKVLKTESSRSSFIFNQNVDDFYFYELEQDENVFVSFIRKQSIDKVLEELTAHNLYCLNFSFGPFVSGVLKSKNKIIYSDNIDLKVSSEILIDFTKSNLNAELQKNIFGDLELDNIDTPLFATAVNYLFPNSNIGLIESQILDSNKEKSLYRKLFEIASISILIFFLSSLFVSYMMLGNFNQEYVELQSKMIHLQDSYDRINTLKMNVADKEEILNSSGIYNEKYLSFYISKITASMSDAIVLDEMTVFPIEKEIKKGKKIIIDAQRIIVLGQSNSSSLFNDWYKNLKKEQWIVKIEIIEYKKVKNKNDKFKLIIQV